MKTVKQLREMIASLTDRVQAIVKLSEIEARDLSADETAEIDRIQGSGEATGEVQALQTQLDRAIKIESLMISNRKTEIEAKVNARIDESEGKKRVLIPARARAIAKQTVFKSDEEAYSMGQWIRATLGGNRNAREWCKDHGVPIRNAMTTGDNTKGGFLLAEPLEASIIELRENYGTFRRDSMMYQMSDAVAILPKLTAEITSYYVGENTAITPSDMTIQQIKLEARKLATLTVISSELNEDSVISVAEMLSRSIAQSFAIQEDQAGFLGDGTSTYGGIVGLAGALGAGSKVTATSLQTFGALTTAFFENVVGSMKIWPGAKPKWYISQNGWANSMQRLLDAVGGNAIQDLANGAPKQFLGYPVEINQVLESRTTGTTGLPACYFGDLRLGTMFGSRRGVNVVTDNSIYFTQDATAVRATERFDINVHDRGTGSVAGGLIQLVFG